MHESSLPNFDAVWGYDEPELSGQRFRALLPEARAAFHF